MKMEFGKSGVTNYVCNRVNKIVLEFNGDKKPITIDYILNYHFDFQRNDISVLEVACAIIQSELVNCSDKITNIKIISNGTDVNNGDKVSCLINIPCDMKISRKEFGVDHQNAEQEILITISGEAW